MSAKKPGLVKLNGEDLKAGPGAYSAETEAISITTGASCVLLIVVEGNRGTGFDIGVRADAVNNIMWQSLANELEWLARIVRERAATLLAEADASEGG